MSYINKEDTINELQFYLLDSEKESCVYTKEEIEHINVGMKFAIKIVKQMSEYEEEIKPVRCSDCKYSEKRKKLSGQEWYHCNYDSKCYGYTEDNFFCSYGEVKE